jgi:archaellum component FlaC
MSRPLDSSLSRSGLDRSGNLESQAEALRRTQVDLRSKAETLQALHQLRDAQEADKSRRARRQFHELERKNAELESRIAEATAFAASETARADAAETALAAAKAQVTNDSSRVVVLTSRLESVAQESQDTARMLEEELVAARKEIKRYKKALAEADAVRDAAADKIQRLRSKYQVVRQDLVSVQEQYAAANEEVNALRDRFVATQRIERDHSLVADRCSVLERSNARLGALLGHKRLTKTQFEALANDFAAGDLLFLADEQPHAGQAVPPPRFFPSCGAHTGVGYRRSCDACKALAEQSAAEFFAGSPAPGGPLAARPTAASLRRSQSARASSAGRAASRGRSDTMLSTEDLAATGRSSSNVRASGLGGLSQTAGPGSAGLGVIIPRRESEYWIPAPAYYIVSNFCRDVGVASDTGRSLLFDLASVWRDREAARAGVAKSQAEREVRALKRQLAQARPYAQVEQQRTIRRLSAQIKALRTGTSSSLGAKTGAPRRASAARSRKLSEVQEELAEVVRSNRALHAKLDAQDRLTSTALRASRMAADALADSGLLGAAKKITSPRRQLSPEYDSGSDYGYESAGDGDEYQSDSSARYDDSGRRSRHVPQVSSRNSRRGRTGYAAISAADSCSDREDDAHARVRLSQLSSDPAHAVNEAAASSTKQPFSSHAEDLAVLSGAVFISRRFVSELELLGARIERATGRLLDAADAAEDDVERLRLDEDASGVVLSCVSSQRSSVASITRATENCRLVSRAALAEMLAALKADEAQQTLDLPAVRGLGAEADTTTASRTTYAADFDALLAKASQLESEDKLAASNRAPRLGATLADGSPSPKRPTARVPDLSRARVPTTPDFGASSSNILRDTRLPPFGDVSDLDAEAAPYNRRS